MKTTLLLIDDNKYLLDVFVIRLAHSLKNCRILTARNGKQGVEILQSTNVDFVLTDLDMPEMNGYQFIEYTRQHFPTLPVYAMTSDCSGENPQRLTALGIRECIEKPFLVEEVTYRIMKRLREEGAEPAINAGSLLMDTVPR